MTEDTATGYPNIEARIVLEINGAFVVKNGPVVTLVNSIARATFYRSYREAAQALAQLEAGGRYTGAKMRHVVTHHFVADKLFEDQLEQRAVVLALAASASAFEQYRHWLRGTVARKQSRQHRVKEHSNPR